MALEARIVVIIKIVQTDHFVPRVERHLGRAGTDESGTAGNEEGHFNDNS